MKQPWNTYASSCLGLGGPNSASLRLSVESLSIIGVCGVSGVLEVPGCSIGDLVVG